MMRMVFLASRIALDAARRSPLTNTTSALSMATSVTLPIAKPTSASLSAGESLMPSPIIATPAGFLPLPALPCTPSVSPDAPLCSRTALSLSSGRTSA